MNKHNVGGLLQQYKKNKKKKNKIKKKKKQTKMKNLEGPEPRA